jgi:hypothetical protein
MEAANVILRHCSQITGIYTDIGTSTRFRRRKQGSGLHSLFTGQKGLFLPAHETYYV